VLIVRNAILIATLDAAASAHRPRTWSETATHPSRPARRGVPSLISPQPSVQVRTTSWPRADVLAELLAV